MNNANESNEALTEMVLDASAVLAVIHGEPGSEVVASISADYVTSTVNLSEVVAKLAEGGMLETEIQAAFEWLGLVTVPFDVEQAYSAGMLRPATRSQGLSLGDRACLALAKQLGSEALTTDRAWSDLDVGVRIRVIR